jgi:hypothetical protein
MAGCARRTSGSSCPTSLGPSGSTTRFRSSGRRAGWSATIVKGRNRDTAWFSLLDSEWPKAKAAFQTWLDPANFDGQGRQKRSLAELRAAG